MSSRERRNHAFRYYASRNPQDVERDKFYEDEVMRYAGESLTIETVTVGIMTSQVSAFVRFDADVAFSITIYKAEWQLFTDAGYTLPTRTTHEKGTYPFTAEITTEWRKAQYGREWSLHVKTVEPKEETMQPETNETALTVVETPAVAAAPDYAAIMAELSRLRDMLTVDILGLTGDALDTATASANAAHYIGNAIGSLERIVAPVTIANDVTERIPTLPEIMAAGDTGNEAAA